MKEQKAIDAQQILEKYDKENHFRIQIGRWAYVVTFLAVALTVFHLYTGATSVLPSQQQGAIHLGTALGIIFLLYPAKKAWRKTQKKVPWYDVLLAFTAMYVSYHKIFFSIRFFKAEFLATAL